MRTRVRLVALVAGAAMTVASGFVLIPSSNAATTGGASTLAACTAPAWAEGNSYNVGSQVTYNGHLYSALVAHTAWPGTGWNPAATPSLWKDLGSCTGGGPSPTTP